MLPRREFFRGRSEAHLGRAFWRLGVGLVSCKVPVPPMTLSAGLGGPLRSRRGIGGGSGSSCPGAFPKLLVCGVRACAGL